MPDFVKENALNEDEKRQQEERELELSKAHLSKVQESERKSLYEQLQDAKEQFDQMIASRNSSYKLDEKSAQFLESVRQEKLRKEEARKLHEASELERFKAMKEKKPEVDTVDTHSPLVLKKRKLATPKLPPSKSVFKDNKGDKKDLSVSDKTTASSKPHQEPLLGLGSYSSDESDESDESAEKGE